jgi:hypothetical protein
MRVLASAGGNSVDATARLVQTSPDRVREMIHRPNELGVASLDPKWARGRPRRVTADFFSVGTVSLRRLCVLFFIHHGTRRVFVSGIMTNPTRAWVTQCARNVAADLREVGYAPCDGSAPTALSSWTNGTFYGCSTATSGTATSTVRTVSLRWAHRTHPQGRSLRCRRRPRVPVDATSWVG